MLRLHFVQLICNVTFNNECCKASNINDSRDTANSVFDELQELEH